jgi:RNA polymerase sigma factor (sigma-70 family)
MYQMMHVALCSVESPPRIDSQNQTKAMIEKCFVEFYGYLCRILVKKGMCSWLEAEDVVQSFFAKLLAKGKKSRALIRKQESKRSWLVRGVLNHAISARRFQLCRAVAEKIFAADHEAWHPSFLGEASEEEVRRVVNQTLSQEATERMRRVFEKQQKGRRYRQIAQELRITKRTVQNDMDFVRALLLSAFLREGYSLPRAILVRSAR